MASGRDAADPNFLLIGAQKCGTTWLSRMIAQHPDVHTPRQKELHFFNKPERYALGIDWYRAQFAGYEGQTAVGEFTPNYLWVKAERGEGRPDRSARVPALVSRHYPEMKLIVLLRDPVERAVSAFYHHIRKGRISRSSGILDVGDRYGILDMGFYHRQLQAWLEYYPREQFLVLLFEHDVLREKERTVRRAFRFLGIDDDFRPQGLEESRNARPRNLELFLTHFAPRLTRRLMKLFPALQRVDLPAIEVTDAERSALAELYAQENRRLEAWLGRDLGIWSHAGGRRT